MSNFTSIFAMFPGQGSQKVGMGKDLYESSEIAREFFNRADKTLGVSLSSICFEGPAEKLTATEFAQPAILTTSVISYELAKAKHGSLDITCAAGHSLGEYSALVAAEALSFDDAVMLVHKRGRYMQEAVPVGSGKMVAVLGKEIPEIEEALKKVSGGVAAIANNNAPGQVVVAGDVAGVDAFVAALGTAKTIPLQVSAPFHCSLMKAAEENLKKDLASLSIAAPKFPVIANYTGKPSSGPEEIRTLLAQQVCGQVRWVESVLYGVETYQPNVAIEFGAGNVLTGLLKRITPTLTRKNIYTGAEE